MHLTTLAAFASAEPLAAIDLLRIAPDHPRVFVQAELPNGRLGLFLVDTGADTSALSAETADELELEVAVGCGELSGLSGRARMDCATIPHLRFGALDVIDVGVAVDVPGLSKTAGTMPLDGLLGNNVWSRYVMELDVPGSRIALHDPEALPEPRRYAEMRFDGHHVYTDIRVRGVGAPTADPRFEVQVDTGASGLKVCGTLGAGISAPWTEGLESLRGIGASETLPPFRFLETTRRIPINRAILGRRGFRIRDDVQWLSFELDDKDECPSGIRALLGFEYLARHRVFFDYIGDRFWLASPRGRRAAIDGHARLLEQFDRNHLPSPERALPRARLLVGAGRDEEALAQLRTGLDDGILPPGDVSEARVLAAGILRARGLHTEAVAMLEPLGPAELVAEGMAVGSVNGLVFDGRIPEALALARAATLARPDDGWAHVAMSDALLADGRPGEAAQALAQAVRLEQYDDAHLLRRSRVALAEGDRHAALAHLRRLLDLYPFGGMFLWFYALLVDSEQDRATFLADMDAALSRLHPADRPLDFEVAALHEIGDQAGALQRRALGEERFCQPLRAGPEHDNCRAWFAALAGVDLDDAVRRIDRALAASGPRADFLDTAAMVHLAVGDWDQALDAARHAARLGPDDVYMVWQAERIADLVRERSGDTDVADPNP